MIRAELLHLRSLRSTYLTALAVVGLVALVAAADAADIKSGPKLEDAFMTAATLLPAIGLALFTAARTAAEFRYGTVAHRALAAPRRARLVAAKLVALTGIALAVTGVAVVAATAATGVTPGAGMVAEILTGVGLFAALGVAVGFLSRNQTAAVLVVFGCWVLEKLLEALTEAVFMPYGLLGAFAQGEALAGAGLAAVTAVALAAAVHSLDRKDVI